MKAKLFEDDYGNMSSFRVIWVVFMAVVVIMIAFLAGFYIRELVVGGEDVNQWLSGLGITGGAGIGGFILATIRKWIEGLNKPKEALYEVQEESEYIAPLEHKTPAVAYQMPSGDVVITINGTFTYQPKES